MFQNRVPNHFPTEIDGPTWKIRITAAERREIERLDAAGDEEYDFLNEHGVAKIGSGEWIVPCKWERGGKFVYFENLSSIMTSYGDKILKNWQKLNGFWENNDDLYQFMPSLRVPASSLTEFRVGMELTRVETQQKVRVVHLDEDLVYPWDKDSQALYVEHVNEEGETDPRTGGYLSDYEVVPFISTSIRNDGVKVQDEEVLGASDLLLVKLAKKMQRLCTPQNVSRNKTTSQDLPPLFVKKFIVPLLNEHGVPVLKNSSAKTLSFVVTDVNVLLDLLPAECLMQKRKRKVFFVACSVNDEVIFTYSWKTSSQTLRVRFNINERKGDDRILSV